MPYERVWTAAGPGDHPRRQLAIPTAPAAPHRPYGAQNHPTPARIAAWIRAGIKPAPTVRMGNSRVNAAVCSIPPCSEAAGAAFEERCVAVTIVRFYCPARSIEGVWGTGRDGPEESSCPRNASPGDARRTAKRGPGAAAPGAFWELFRGEKFPAGGSPVSAVRAPAAGAGRFQPHHRRTHRIVDNAHRASTRPARPPGPWQRTAPRRRGDY